VENWPIRTSHGMVRADFSDAKETGRITFHLKVMQGQPIPKLAVRLPAKGRAVWQHHDHVEEVQMDSTTAP
jgi:hypothetical protein